jgi:VIT1/CCC1 family predicted Fe2+/Mn2+ transporter
MSAVPAQESDAPAGKNANAGAAAPKKRFPPGLSPSDAKEAIFGSFDGMTSTLGVVAGLLATNSSAPHIVAGAIGIAVAATIGMGAGQYLSDGERNVRKALVMAAATLIGSVLPAIPFLFGTSTACVLASVGITLAAAAVIGHFRGYLVTYSILIVVSVLTVGLSIAVA